MDLVIGIETLDQIPETFTVMVVNQMTNLVDDNIVDDFVRGHDQLAVEVKVVFARATPPDTWNFFQDYAIVGNIEEFGEEIYFLSNNPFAII